MDDRNTTVPDWFVKYYDTGYYWAGITLLILLAIVLIVVACRLYYEMKEAERSLDEHEKE